MGDAQLWGELGLQGLAVSGLVALVRRYAPGLWHGRPRLVKLGVVAAASVLTTTAQAAFTGADLTSSSGRGAVAFAIGIALRELIRREAPAVIEELTSEQPGVKTEVR